ncbi:hypothetical protein POSPLADRAFT_1062133 [Postia placenta MAD-698-R-SB12]|uniref:Uncharacterized protein n=1 Tax=Postia placenta MAD-698-R-SB12 TaxID=670580 RepID=A0A1X6MLM6_9APHY|nr:hypothetical protein POSPLADRAFT_1062133 [Postia placenta MAD-698-R-SB12]OSX56983.1 hypothetical protein POSPLADRAFT_1062133 [Postia placenta MAD-698-R-SB12]
MSVAADMREWVCGCDGWNGSICAPSRLAREFADDPHGPYPAAAATQGSLNLVYFFSELGERQRPTALLPMAAHVHPQRPERLCPCFSGETFAQCPAAARSLPNHIRRLSVRF